MGTKNSASPTVSRPLRASSLARSGPTPFKNWSGVARPAGARVCLVPVIVLLSLLVSAAGNSSSRSHDGAAVRSVRERSVRRQHGEPRSQADAPTLAAESGIDAGPRGRPDEARARVHALP